MSLLCLLATQAELRACMAESVDSANTANTAFTADWLSPSEQARLAGLTAEARRQSFLAGRWLARLAVRRWRGDDRLPVLTVQASGACRVAADSGVFVSISHSGEQVACAVAAVPVGVDVERVGRSRDHLAIARAVHGEVQQQALAALPEPDRESAFLQLWTMKEAWLKARDSGLDFAQMRALAFDEDPRGDVAVAEAPGLVLALAADAALPAVIEGEAVLAWRRYRSRQVAAG